MKIILDINNNYYLSYNKKSLFTKKYNCPWNRIYILKKIFSKKELLKIINTWKDDEIMMLNYKIYNI